MIEKIKSWLDAIRDYPSLLEDYEELKGKYFGVVDDYYGLSDKLDECEELIPKQQDVDAAEYWNTKWKQSTVRYRAPKSRKVTEYVKDREIVLIDSISDVLIKRNNLSVSDVDVIPLVVLKWLESKFKKKEFKYVLDKGERWYTPEETLEIKKGDCDDWGILEYYIIRKIFQKLGCWEVVRHRIKCVAGNVNGRGVLPTNAGGHFYLMWLHSDGEWYVIESTYYRPMSILNYGRKPMKLNPMYGTIWFTFNDQYSWSQHSITVTKNDFKKT